MGYIVWVRKGTYNCPRGLGIASVKHTFVLIELPTMGAQPVYYVVDPNYKEHFELSGSGSEDYKRLLAARPSVFVGGAEQLSALVHLLCAEVRHLPCTLHAMSNTPATILHMASSFFASRLARGMGDEPCASRNLTLRFVRCAHVCAMQMEKVFELRGVALPPWRCPGVMQGRYGHAHALATCIHIHALLVARSLLSCAYVRCSLQVVGKQSRGRGHPGHAFRHPGCLYDHASTHSHACGLGSLLRYHRTTLPCPSSLSGTRAG